MARRWELGQHEEMHDVQLQQRAAFAQRLNERNGGSLEPLRAWPGGVRFREVFAMVANLLRGSLKHGGEAEHSGVVHREISQRCSFEMYREHDTLILIVNRAVLGKTT